MSCSVNVRNAINNAQTRPAVFSNALELQVSFQPVSSGQTLCVNEATQYGSGP